MRALYVIMLIGSAVFYVFYRDNLSFLLLVTLLLMPAFNFLLLTVSAAFVEAGAVCENGAVERGEKIKVLVNLKNRSFIPVSCVRIDLYYRGYLEKKPRKHSLMAPIPARESQTVNFSVSPDHCGRVDLKIKKIRLYDSLGLFSVSKPLGFEAAAAVVPRLIPYKAAYISESLKTDFDSESFSKVKSGDDPSEVFSLREYREGDSPKLIHWKLSGRVADSEFIVKELSEPVSSQVLLIPNFGSCKELSETDGLFDMFASLAKFLTDENAPFSALRPEEDKMSAVRVSDEEDFLRLIYENALELQSDGGDRFEPDGLISGIFSDNRIYSHIIYISYTVDVYFLNELSALGVAERISCICTGEKAGVNPSDVPDAEVYFASAGSAGDEPGNFVI